MQNDRVDKYHIITKLDQKNITTVYLSIVPKPTNFNKLLVVKLLKEELVHNPDFLSIFLNETHLTTHLNHANIVHTYEINTDKDQQFLVMNYLDDQPLHTILHRVHREKIPLDVHVRILADILANLHYAHTLTDFDSTPLHVVHHNVSPQNIFMTYDNQMKIVDFDIAKTTGTTNTTQSNIFKNKMNYVTPEQTNNNTINTRADIFNMNIIL